MENTLSTLYSHLTMTVTTKNITETTDSIKINTIFSESISTLNVTGSLLLNEHYSAPWAISVPSTAELTELLTKKNNTHIAAFHLVRRGRIEIEIQNGRSEIINEGEMAICFSGKAHTLFQGVSKPAYPFQNLMQGNQNIFEPTTENKTQATSLICGIFTLHNTQLNPLFEAMPPLLKVSLEQGDYRSISTTNYIIKLLVNELEQPSFSHSYMVERYLELLCAQSMQTYVQSMPKGETGWLQAINDTVMSRIIAAIHSKPDFEWSVIELAKLISLSPSRFAARFTEVMGITPMAYVTRWRMYIASQLLKNSNFNLEQIATQVGYGNVAAFSRAFKRLLGLSPANWRTQNQSDN